MAQTPEPAQLEQTALAWAGDVLGSAKATNLDKGIAALVIAVLKS